MKHCFSILLFLCVFLPAGQAARFYVNGATGNDASNGTSWATAFKTFQKAIEAAGNNDEIWLTSGTYRPTKDFSGQSLPNTQRVFLGFYINKALQVYGRFAGTETLTTQRNPNNAFTILSADIDGDDLNNPAQSEADIQGENGSRLLYMTNLPGNGTIRLDNLVVTGTYGEGGLLLLNGGNNVTISHCRFTGNLSNYYDDDAFGGAEFVGGNGGFCNPKVDNCSFDHNSNYDGAGGAFVWAATGPSSATFTNCTFESNLGGGLQTFAANGLPCNVTATNCNFLTNDAKTTGSSGGGILCVTSNLTCTTCTFGDNQANSGGAIYGSEITGNNKIQLNNCYIHNNEAGRGGAIYLEGANLNLNGGQLAYNGAQDADGGGILIEPSIFNLSSAFFCNDTKFQVNKAAMNGGAICDRDPLAYIQVERANFNGNGGRNGGAIYMDFENDCNLNTNIFQSIFSWNTALYGNGGAIFTRQAPGTSHPGGLGVQACTFFSNDVSPYNTTLAGANILADNAEVNSSNSIYWGNGPVSDHGEFYAINDGKIYLSQCLLQSADCAVSGATTCNNIIYNHDPLFVDPVNLDFHLPMCSPAVNTGTVTGGSAGNDYDGNPRPYNDGTGALDMGVYEFQGTPPNNFYRDQDGDGYGIVTFKIKACTAPPGFAAQFGDCADFDPEINPGAIEICDTKDNNCNGLVDYLDPVYVDNEPPVFTGNAPANLTLTCADAVPAPAVLTATDNCSPTATVTMSATSTRSNNPNTCAYYTYTIVRTWTAKDLKNNTATRTQVIEVKDDQAPVFTVVSPNVTIACDDAIPGYIPPTAVDNCSPVTITLVTTSTRSADPNDCAYYTYSLTRTWTAKDKCNNTSTAQQIISIQDTKAPYVLFPPAPQVFVECNEAIPQITSLNSQDCDAHPILTVTETSESFEADPYDHIFQRITRHISLTDHCGNSVEFQQIVNVRDTKPPHITNCPADIKVFGTEAGATVDYPAANVVESCDYTLLYTPVDPGGSFPVGTTQVYVDVYDIGGNVTSCSFKVTVLDDFKVHCQPDVYVAIPNGTNPDQNTVNWNLPFAKPCNFCDTQESQSDFQEDFQRLGSLNGHRYYLSNHKMSTTDAATSCTERQGYLVSIGDKTENIFLANELAGQAITIGLNDQNQEGNFLWANGQNTTYNNWAPNNPFSGVTAENQDFVRLGADGRWLNVNNDTALFVCEVNCYDIKKVSGDTPVNHAFSTGIYNERYAITDICGRTDTCKQNVFVKRSLQSYCSPNLYPSELDQDTTLWIKSFHLGSLNQVSGNNKGYYRHISLAQTFETGQTYPLDVVTATNQSGPANTYVRIWLDLNADRDFYDAGELLIDTFLPAGVLHTTLKIPAGTVTGDLRQRLRVATSRFAAPEACGDFTTGEVEDYRVAFTSSNAVDPSAADRNGASASALLYPNPASDIAWLSMENFEGLACKIRILSVSGALVRTLAVAEAGMEPLRLDLSGMASGVYFVQIQADGAPIETEKLIINQE